MISILMKNTHEVAEDIAGRAKDERLSLNLSQKTLSERSGVSYGTLKKFEQTGQISLESLLKLALALDALDAFQDIFAKVKKEELTSLDELMKDNTRKRGRN